MLTTHELSHQFDRKSGRGSFELVALELDAQGRFLNLGAWGLFHYTLDSDYPALRRQAEADTLRHYQRILALEQNLGRAPSGTAT
jgi:hypothetical protein